jgi:hypothetical protein
LRGEMLLLFSKEHVVVGVCVGWCTRVLLLLLMLLLRLLFCGRSCGRRLSLGLFGLLEWRRVGRSRIVAKIAIASVIACE